MLPTFFLVSLWYLTFTQQLNSRHQHLKRFGSLRYIKGIQTVGEKCLNFIL